MFFYEWTSVDFELNNFEDIMPNMTSGENEIVDSSLEQKEF